MMKLTLDNIQVKDHKIYDNEGNYRGEILYQYMRGSQLYHTNVETSDVDEGGIYIMPNNALLGLGYEYQNEIKDSKNDKCIWEIGRFLELAMSSNPSVIEALFVPDDKVIYEHPIIKVLKTHKEEFVTKKAFAPFGGYAVSQIKKAQGQNKKIHWDIVDMKRKSPLDFCYTFYRQGSMPIEKWLEERGLDQRNCGMVSVPNMPDMYGVYYDFGQHFKLNGITKDYFCDENNRRDKFLDFCYNWFCSEWDKENMSFGFLMSHIWENNKTPKGGYCGIVSPDLDSNQIRFTSVPDKNEKAICYMYYNGNGYQLHCRKYKEYEEWKNNRNKARYESNLEGERSGNADLKYDSKNMMHCFRLMAMAKEIAEGKGVLLDRTDIDRDFLLDVRNRKYGYSDLNKMMLDLKMEMDKAIENSTIRESIDADMVNKILLYIRNNFN